MDELLNFWDTYGNQIERKFVESGLECCTVTTDLGHRCGYVAVPKNHPLFGKSYENIYHVIPNLSVNGGVTFAKGTDSIWVFGWDAGHNWNKPDISIMSKQAKKAYEKYKFFYSEDGVVIDADMAEEETRKFARQIASV